MGCAAAQTSVTFLCRDHARHRHMGNGVTRALPPSECGLSNLRRSVFKACGASLDTEAIINQEAAATLIRYQHMVPAYQRPVVDRNPALCRGSDTMSQGPTCHPISTRVQRSDLVQSSRLQDKLGCSSRSCLTAPGGVQRIPSFISASGA